MDWKLIKDGKRPDKKEAVLLIIHEIGLTKDNKQFPVTALALGSYDPETQKWDHMDEHLILAWKYADAYPLPEGIELTMCECILKE